MSVDTAASTPMSKVSRLTDLKHLKHKGQRSNVTDSVERLANGHRVRAQDPVARAPRAYVRPALWLRHKPSQANHRTLPHRVHCLWSTSRRNEGEQAEKIEAKNKPLRWWTEAPLFKRNNSIYFNTLWLYFGVFFCRYLGQKRVQLLCKEGVSSSLQNKAPGRTEYTL